MDSGRRKWYALGALALSLLVVGLDLTVLNVALPTLATDLGASTGQLQWFADSYNLVLAAALLPAGMLGDRFGRKKMLLIALSLFGAASLACSFATSAGELIAGRAVLGLGAAGLMPLSMAVLPVLFTPEERPRALTIWITANSLGIPLGPIVGGWLLDHYHWGSIFLINVPVVIVGLVAIAFLLPESRNPVRSRIDVLGVVTSSLGLVGLTYGIIEGGEQGWTDPVTLIALAIGLASLAGFVAWQRRTEHPLVDLGAVPLAELHVGRHPRDALDVRAVRRAVRDAAVLPGGHRRRRARHRPAAAAGHRRPAASARSSPTASPRGSGPRGPSRSASRCSPPR